MLASSSTTVSASAGRRSTSCCAAGGGPARQAGIVTGLALFAIVDEGLNPIIGSSAPPQAYPLSIHIRGLVGHLAYGLALAAAVEGASLLVRHAPRR